MVSISLCMIVKNEEAVLRRCLDSVNSLVDEIIIVDTGSTDQTIEVAKKFDAKVYEFRWVNDFSKARNEAFSKATKSYILWLDADDVILEEDREKLLLLKNQLSNDVDAVSMPYHLLKDKSGNVLSSLRRNRLVKRERNFKWIGAVHEYLEVGGHIIHSEAAVTHLPLTHDASRNIQIYEERLAKGEIFSTRDLFYFANELKDHGHFDRAIEYYERFLGTKLGWIEDNILACSRLADCYVNIGNEEKSLHAILTSFHYDKPRPEFCCKVGNVFFEKGQYETAIYWYEKALETTLPETNAGYKNLSYEHWIPNIQLCVCYDRLGDYKRADYYNKKAGAVRPDDLKYLQNKQYFMKKLAGQPRSVLIASPILQSPEILRYFLQSIKQIDSDGLTIDYYFIDDNLDQQSTNLLLDFQKEGHSVILVEGTNKQNAQYKKDDVTHYWNDSLVWKVAGYKDQMLKYARDKEYDYVFLLDSDLLLKPNTLKHLLKQEKEIISEIFWTKWQPDSMEQPQVWMTDEYNQFRQDSHEKLTEKQVSERFREFIAQLRLPGVYEIGGLGACTLISRQALQKGVSFKKIPNLTFWGEDRHFSIRAQALGISLWVDTHYPAYHIYRKSDLSGAEKYLNHKPHITLSMIMRNESNKYLGEMLIQHREFIDAAVIIDDASEDGSAEVCKELLKDIPHKIIRNDQSRFSNEIELRKQQWEETIKTCPDWILNLDADEIVEEGGGEKIRALVSSDEYQLYSFRIFDFWNKHAYREDEIWNAHSIYRPLLFRYNKHFQYEWQEKKQHCGRFPSNIYQFPNTLSSIRIKHFGWVTSSIRQEKYFRYKKLDPEGSNGNQLQYESILDSNPRLIRWKENLSKT